MTEANGETKAQARPKVVLSLAQRLRQAAVGGIGLKLSPEEVRYLYAMETVQQQAHQDDLKLAGA